MAVKSRGKYAHALMVPVYPLPARVLFTAGSAGFTATTCIAYFGPYTIGIGLWALNIAKKGKSL